MRLLYISVHEPLQYDEVRLFTSMGIETHVGLHGGKPAPMGYLRPPVGTPMAWHDRIRDYDAVVVMGYAPAVLDVLERGARRVIWRAIGQSSPEIETQIAAARDQIEIVRYSPREQFMPNYAGEDAVIRFYKDPADFKPWTGGGGIAVVSNKFGHRWTVDFRFIESALSGRDWRLYGVGNDHHANSAGQLSDTDLLEAYRQADVFFAPHTIPANYTMGLMEAMMAGAPIVSFSREAVRKRCNMESVLKRMGSPYAAELSELDEILGDGAGLLAAAPHEATAHVDRLLADPKFRKATGKRGRKRAIELFGADKIRRQWADLLGVGRPVVGWRRMVHACAGRLFQ